MGLSPLQLRAAICLCLLLGLAPGVRADLLETIQSLQLHPQVMAEKSKFFVSEAGIAQQQARWYPTVSMSTEGGERIWGHTSQSTSRAFGDDGYVDLVVSGRQLLYDFGATDSYIDQAKYTGEADRYRDAIALNILVSDLVKSAVEYVDARARLELVTVTLDELSGQRDLARERFTAGVSNGDEYRRLEIDLDRLIRERTALERAQSDISRRLIERFAININAAIELSEALVHVELSSASIERFSERAVRFRELAADAKMEASIADKKPRLELELELRSFDLMDKPGSENELTGNLQVRMPFFDGGALDAKVRVAEFERNVVKQEREFAQRVLNEQLARVAEERITLRQLKPALENQRDKVADDLDIIKARQGKTAVGIGQINSGVMALYQLDAELLDLHLRERLLDVELLTLNEHWPLIIGQLVDTLGGQ